MKKLTNTELDCSPNIITYIETGVGKFTWNHNSINFMQSIQIEEITRRI